MPSRAAVVRGRQPVVAQLLDGQWRNAVAGPPDDLVDDVDRDLGSAFAQIPARAFRQYEIDDRRHDGYCQPARQRQEPKGVRVAGEQDAEERQHGKGDRQRIS